MKRTTYFNEILMQMKKLCLLSDTRIINLFWIWLKNSRVLQSFDLESGKGGEAIRNIISRFVENSEFEHFEPTGKCRR